MAPGRARPLPLPGGFVLMGLLSINLFVGVIVDNFNKIKAESDGSATMTPEQQQWVDTMKAMAQVGMRLKATLCFGAKAEPLSSPSRSLRSFHPCLLESHRHRPCRPRQIAQIGRAHV